MKRTRREIDVHALENKGYYPGIENSRRSRRPLLALRMDKNITFSAASWIKYIRIAGPDGDHRVPVFFAYIL
jgi:hypothetical protein